jgi:hypothetical protein
MRVYDTYRFLDKDPEIDRMRTAWQDSGMKLTTIARIANMASATPNSWFGGKTKRPQNASICAFMGALGYERRWIRSDRMRSIIKKKLARKPKPNGHGS